MPPQILLQTYFCFDEKVIKIQPPDNPLLRLIHPEIRCQDIYPSEFKKKEKEKVQKNVVTITFYNDLLSCRLFFHFFMSLEMYPRPESNYHIRRIHIKVHVLVLLFEFLVSGIVAVLIKPSLDIPTHHLLSSVSVAHCIHMPARVVCMLETEKQPSHQLANI